VEKKRIADGTDNGVMAANEKADEERGNDESSLSLRMAEKILLKVL
jgi:hypothetical protein